MAVTHAAELPFTGFGAWTLAFRRGHAAHKKA